jgi:hypothetical protein
MTVREFHLGGFDNAIIRIESEDGTRLDGYLLKPLFGRWQGRYFLIPTAKTQPMRDYVTAHDYERLAECWIPVDLDKVVTARVITPSQTLKKPLADKVLKDDEEALFADLREHYVDLMDHVIQIEQRGLSVRPILILHPWPVAHTNPDPCMVEGRRSTVWWLHWDPTARHFVRFTSDQAYLMNGTIEIPEELIVELNELFHEELS